MPCVKLETHLLGKYSTQFGYVDVNGEPIVRLAYDSDIKYKSFKDLWEEWEID